VNSWLDLSELACQDVMESHSLFLFLDPLNPVSL